MNESFDNDVPKLTARVKAGGCAAKLGSAELQSILAKVPVIQSPQLIAGMEGFEDAAVYKISDDLAIVETIDFFPPLVDDPFLFGQIAAANALSDVYAMGAKPILALNVLCFPTCDYPMSVLEEILKGGASKVEESGASLAGGHSIQATDPVYGLAVTGLVHPDKVLTNGGARASDVLVLTKKIGSGVSLLGLKGEELEPGSQKELFESLTALNDQACGIALRYPVNGMTDITGFGLAGHLLEMAKSSKLAVELNIDRVPFFSQAVELAGQGFVPAGAYGNRQSFSDFITYIKDVNLELQDLIFDPQTSGGLLMALPEGEAEALLKELGEAGIVAACVGRMHEPQSEGFGKEAGQLFVV